MATGGNSTHDRGIGYYDNPVIESVAVLFMFIGGINFSLHFLAWRQRRIVNYLRDPETRVYVSLLIVSVLLYTVVLWASQTHADPGTALRVSLFHAVSMQTTSGFVTEDFTHWPGALPVILHVLP